MLNTVDLLHDKLLSDFRLCRITLKANKAWFTGAPCFSGEAPTVVCVSKNCRRILNNRSSAVNMGSVSQRRSGCVTLQPVDVL